MKDLIMYYPVGNGDQSVIRLRDNTIIFIDCNFRLSCNGNDDPRLYDVKSDVMRYIQRRNGNPYIDIFILSHGDCDHCRGFRTNFYQGDPQKYSEKNKKNEEIIIDEMWFSPMIAEEHTNDDENAYQQEAERRLDLHRKNSLYKDLPGNRIMIVGYDGNKDYSDLNHLRATPGSVVTTFNNKVQNTFSTFIHAPFKEHLTSAEKNKNSTSIVFQARFKNSPIDASFSGLAMFGGDSDHYSWNIILEKTKKYQNDLKEQALNWDLFLAPHHCSWSFFNDTPQEDNPIPQETSLTILDYKRTGGKIIASSKVILDNDDNPPHYAAKEQYVNKLDSSSNFLNTAIYPTESAPQPIIFEIASTGICKIKSESEIEAEKLTAATAVAFSAVIKKPWAY